MQHLLNSFFNFSTLLVLAAAMLDILANMLLAASRGFRRLAFGYGSLAIIGLAFYLLSIAVHKIDLAVAYALWGSFGLLGTSLGGWIFFGQRLKFCAFLGIAIQITGIILLHL